MALITLRDICMSFGAEPLLDQVNLTVASGDRIGLQDAPITFAGIG